MAKPGKRNKIKTLIILSLIGFASYKVYEELKNQEYQLGVDAQDEVARFMHDADSFVWDFQRNRFNTTWLNENLPQVKRRCVGVFNISLKYEKVIAAVDEVHETNYSDRIQTINNFCKQFISEKTINATT